MNQLASADGSRRAAVGGGSSDQRREVMSVPSLSAQKKDVLAQAVKLPAAERSAFIHAQFVADQAAGHEVAALLERYQRATESNPGWTSETTFGALRDEAAHRASLPPDSTAVLTINRKFGPYRIVRVLKPGGMGEVAIADDARLPRQVVLKCLSGRWLATPLARQRLMREARAAAALSHSNIATLYDVLEDTEQPMLVMEYVEGRTLRDVLHDGPLSLGLALRYAIQITDAVSYAHDRGIVHCDIKPSNVQITPSHVAKVLDFGLARAQFDDGDELSRSESGKLMGTPGYMPPERLIEGTLNTAGDVYALGVVLFEMLTNRPPYLEIGPQLMVAVLATDAPAPSSLVPGLPPQLDAIVARALARNPDFRYRSARELARDLVEALGAIEGRAWSGQLQLVEPPRLAIDWRRLTAAALGVSAFVVLAGFVTNTMYTSPLGIATGFDKESALAWPRWGLRAFAAPVILMALIGVACTLALFFIRLVWTNVAAVRRACQPLTVPVQTWITRINVAPTSAIAPLLLAVQVVALGVYAWHFRDIISGLDSLFTRQAPGSLFALRPGNRLAHDSMGVWLTVQLFVFGVAWYQLLKRRWTRHDSSAATIVLGGFGLLAFSFLIFQAIPFRLLYHAEAERVMYQSQTCYLVGQRGDDALLFCPTQPPPWRQIIRISDPNLKKVGTFESVFAALDRQN
jgi:protein kinase-like protein